MSKADLMKELIEKYGYEQETISQLDEAQLKSLVTMESEEGPGVDFENAEEEVEEAFGGDVEELQEQIPTRVDPEWNDYVLSKLTPSEFRGSNPLVHGLRRVSELLVGQIIDNDPKILQFPDPTNEYRATATVRVTYLSIEDGTPLTFAGSADACPENIPESGGKTVDKHPVAMAETRAYGRAYRNALGLRTVAAEELATRSEESQAEVENVVSKIKPHQLIMIDTLASDTGRGMDINVEKFLESMQKSGELVYNSVRELNETDGAKIISKISSHQAKAADIPDELRGYDANWRK